MKTIVAATDFSPASLNAVNYAADMAAHLQMRLCIVHVCELPLVATEVPYPAYNVRALIAAAEKDISDVSKKITARLSNLPPIRTEVKVGLVIDQINEVCSELVPYAVVMGLTGRGSSAERFLFGSTTLAALNHLYVPLIIVPAGISFMPIHRVGIASDFENVSATIPFYEIKDLVKKLHANLHVLHIKQKETTHHKEHPHDEFRIFRDLMNDLNPTYHIIERDNIEDGIKELVKSAQIDLLIVIPGRHSGLEKIFHRSHSRKLALSAPVPILSVHEVK